MRIRSLQTFGVSIIEVQGANLKFLLKFQIIYSTLTVCRSLKEVPE